MPNELTLEELVYRVAGGRALLFLGAGFSVGAQNLDGVTLPAGSQLLDELCASLGISRELGLEQAAEYYADEHGIPALNSLVRKKYTVRTAPQETYDLAQLPWLRVYTTNYDNVFEIAAAANGRTTTSLVLTSTASADQTLQIVHLNGSVSYVPQDINTHAFTLGTSAYVESRVNESIWAEVLRGDIARASAVVIVGYSMFDLDIQRIVGLSDEVRRKTIFFLGKNPNEMNVRRCAKFGAVLRETVEPWAQSALHQLRSVETDGIPKLYLSVEQIFFDPADNTAALHDVISLTMYGVLNRGLLAAQMINPDSAPYVIISEHHENVSHLLQSDGSIVVVHAHSANGKSVLCEVVGQLRAKEGGLVLRPLRASEEAVNELIEIVTGTSGSLLILENYAEWMNHLPTIFASIPSNTCVLLTARTPTHWIRGAQLAEKIPRAIIEYDSNPVSPNDIPSIHRFMNSNGFISAQLMAEPEPTRRRHLTERCDEWREVFLLAVESEIIQTKMGEVSEILDSTRNANEAVIGLLSIAIIGFSPPVGLISGVWDSATESQFHAISAESPLRDVIAAGRASVRMRSTVCLPYILKNIKNRVQVISAVTKLFRYAANHRHSQHYRDILYELSRFRNLQTIFGKERLAEVIQVYGNVRAQNTVRSMPLFWLQYSLAYYYSGNLPHAEWALKTAYSEARKAGGSFDTYQIDNHAARVSLDRVRKGMSDDTENDVEKAIRLLRIGTHGQGSVLYVYRVATVLPEILVQNLGLTDSTRRLIEQLLQELDTKVAASGDSFTAHWDIRQYQQARELWRGRP
jgi:hypothetical protein